MLFFVRFDLSEHPSYWAALWPLSLAGCALAGPALFQPRNSIANRLAAHFAGLGSSFTFAARHWRLLLQCVYEMSCERQNACRFRTAVNLNVFRWLQTGQKRVSIVH
jgi:hypothetical protein